MSQPGGGKPKRADIELSFYEKFFFSTGRDPYPVQDEAFAKIFNGDSVLVTVPTGTGKTMMAKAAMWNALERGEKVVYTTPLRALTEEKFREFCEDFGEERVGFATGDYKVRPEAPLQVVVAEILWNRIIADRNHTPAEVVVMDEGHYFNDFDRGYVWEQSIIGLDPRTQLIILSATIGDAVQFCNWVYSCRKVTLELVQSFDRRVPLIHEFREQFLIDVVKQLAAAGDVPAIIFTFGREACFDRARLLKSCPRFTTEAERALIEKACEPILLERGLSKDLKSLLLHGIGIHHAGILPKYKALVERLTLERLLKFVVSTETIAAGINLPAKRVIFPELRKFVQGKARLLTSAEYLQMAGRAGRPQFDTEGIAITLAPEEIVSDLRKELKDAQKNGYKVDEAKVRRSVYARAQTSAKKNNEIIWDQAALDGIVSGKPASLRSQTKVTAEQVLAIGLPDLTVESLELIATETGTEPPPAPVVDPSLPASMNLNVATIIRHLLLPERERREAEKRLAMVTANLRALGVVDEHGVQVKGDMINQLRGLDGLFVWHVMMNRELSYEEAREFVEYLVDHDVIQKILDKEGDEKRREWTRNRLRDMRRDQPMATWEDAEAEYLKQFPRELTLAEKMHSEFLGLIPHGELHAGRKWKTTWAKMEDEGLSFLDFVERYGLAHEEGNLFSYLSRVMKFARMLKDVTTIGEFETLEGNIRRKLSVVDERVLEELG